MGRLLYANGARGPAVEMIQRKLVSVRVDGDYGAQTAAAIAGFQEGNGLPQTGSVDEETWASLTQSTIPSLFERCLAVTAAFEGHGYSLAKGNFDGGGITWGIIGFTLASGSLSRVIRAIDAADPDAIDRSFDTMAKEIRRKIGFPYPEQMAWARAISPGGELVAAWRNALGRLGREPVARRIQNQHARQAYFEPAWKTAEELGFADELGVALCFDIQVQNGGPKGHVRQQVAVSPMTGVERRELIARLASASALPQWQDDVLERKLTLAIGSGQVHGRLYELAHWGLGEYDAEYQTGSLDYSRKTGPGTPCGKVLVPVEPKWR